MRFFKAQSDKNEWTKSSRNSANIALRQAKREYYTTKFQNPKTNPKHAWQTIDDILGRNNNQSIQQLNIRETQETTIKYSGKSVTSNEYYLQINIQ